jgi:hypothetical protein
MLVAIVILLDRNTFSSNKIVQTTSGTEVLNDVASKYA